MTRLMIVFALLFGTGILGSASVAAQEARVELELIMARGFPPEDAHRWMRALEDVGADSMRMRQARNGDATGVKNVGTESRPRYKVYGLLTGDGKLSLPGGTYRMSDTAVLMGKLG